MSCVHLQSSYIGVYNKYTYALKYIENLKSFSSRARTCIFLVILCHNYKLSHSRTFSDYCVHITIFALCMHTVCVSTSLP